MRPHPRCASNRLDSGFAETCLDTVTRQKLRLTFGDFRKLGFERLSDARMQRATRFTQERAIGRISNQRVLEHVIGAGRNAMPEQQTSRNESVERRSQLRL